MNTQNFTHPAFPDLLQKTLRCSRYARRTLEADSGLLVWLQESYGSPCDRDEILHLLHQEEAGLLDEVRLARVLRTLRKQVMVKLILRDLNGLCDLNEVMNAMTCLAEVVLQQGLECLARTLEMQFGRPLGEDSHAVQQMLVVGMGKLGGGELNVSSDIDLIFLYAEDGETEGERTLSNHEFFTRLARRLINIVNETTGDGYVFRVDMRLRPYGESGPLVMSFAALEEYLASQGREWERYAWIKARVVAPASCDRIAELNGLYQPFVFRKYLDFSAIDSMRKLHEQVRREVQRRDRLDNIKLGPGGIREIEFTAQVFQLIRGGRDARLRILPTRVVLRRLAENGLLPENVVADLDASYVFLRNLEHRLQYLDDQQTQDLPVNEEDRQIVAEAMGYADYAALMADMGRHRAPVSAQFEQIFSQPDVAQSRVWREGLNFDELAQELAALGFSAASAERLIELRKRQMSEEARQRVDVLIPQFIALSSDSNDPDATLVRFLNLLDAIMRRVSYLAFLAEYPEALKRLAKLLSASSWAAGYLARHPALFDELLDAREFYQPPSWHEIELDLQQRLAGLDAERQLDVLHQVQQEQVFYLLAMDLQGLLPLEKLSDHLSDLADMIMNHVLNLCWSVARKKHAQVPRFAIIAYGKLGGREMGYASDLDMVFLYDDDHPDAQENYVRLGKSINAMLGSYTTSGRLYETDLRLRPNGASGLLVSSVDAFRDYQLNEAWVWEHQALTRARFCAGDKKIGEAFDKIRSEVLRLPREPGDLRAEIVRMRQKMHEGHPNDSGLFDIKHDSGGMVDIEFMVQYLVLAHANRHPELVANSGNLALLKVAAELGLIDVPLAEKVRELYRILRRMQHRMRLNDVSPCRIPQGEIDISACRELWRALFGA
jgi:[glutamine synthetase] adenylyltransferase / [glutamine synthetase]-adenylyl-L-tyrosine phosphorylase